MMRRHAWLLMGVALALPSAAEDKAAPHGLGLLAGRVSDDAARARLQAALSDPRPSVRAAAVRVINVSGVGPLVPAVAAALAVENDPMAAFEMIRFLASIRHPDGDADAIGATRRLGPPVHEALVDSLGRRGAAASAHIPTLRALGLDDFTWRMFYRLAMNGAQDGAGPLAAAVLKEGEPKAWQMVLEAMRQVSAELDGGLAVAGVRSQQVSIRTETYWHLALTLDPARPADPTVASALDEAPEARTEANDKTAAVAFEVLSRRRGRAAHPLAASMMALGSALRETMPREALAGEGVLKVFDKDERKALGIVFFDDEKALDEKRVVLARRRNRDGATWSVVETPRGFPTGYVADLVQAAGCDFKGWGGLLSGEVSYGPDGRPRNVGIVPRGASKPCLEATRALLVSALAPLGVPSRAGEKALLLVPDRPEFMKCLDEASNVPPRRLGDRSDGRTPSGVIQEPRKIRDVQPHYPEAARLARVQGVVIVEATITSSGCVQGISLLRGLQTHMDLEAIRAVSGWAYDPVLLDGQPVPVLMTVAVNYKLN